MGLEFAGFFAEGTLDALAQLKFGSRQRTLKIGKAFPPEVLEFGDKGLKLFNVLSQVVDRKGLRPRPFRFCACHTAWKKCSPRPAH